MTFRVKTSPAGMSSKTRAPPENAKAVVKTENLNYARAKVSYANYFDPSTDEVYFRVRNANDLSYATQYRQLNKDTFVGSQNMTVFAYLGGQGQISKSYQFAANMYSSVANGWVQVGGEWIP